MHTGIPAIPLPCQSAVYPLYVRQLEVFLISKLCIFQHNQRYLDISGFVNHCVFMQSIKISSKVDAETWEELKELARESHQNVSGLLTEAISEYIQRKRVRPVVLKHLEDSMAENEALGKLLAK